MGMAQGELGRLVGVSRDSIQRWELVRVPPRPISHVVWAQTLNYTLALRPINILDRRLSQSAGKAEIEVPFISWRPQLTGRAR
jgi:hypothetical protein